MTDLNNKTGSTELQKAFNFHTVKDHNNKIQSLI